MCPELVEGACEPTFDGLSPQQELTLGNES